MSEKVYILAGPNCPFCGTPDKECTESTLRGGPYCCKKCEENDD